MLSFVDEDHLMLVMHADRVDDESSKSLIPSWRPDEKRNISEQTSLVLPSDSEDKSFLPESLAQFRRLHNPWLDIQHVHDSESGRSGEKKNKMFDTVLFLSVSRSHSKSTLARNMFIPGEV